MENLDKDAVFETGTSNSGIVDDDCVVLARAMVRDGNGGCNVEMKTEI